MGFLCTIIVLLKLADRFEAKGGEETTTMNTAGSDVKETAGREKNRAVPAAGVLYREVDQGRRPSGRPGLVEADR